MAGWTLAADVYVNASDDAQATTIKARLRGRPEVERSSGGRADAQMGGAPIEISGCPITPPIASTGHCLNPPPTPDLAASRRYRADQRTIGPAPETRDRRPDRVAAPGGNWLAKIVGIYADYGNPKGQIAVNYAALTRRFPRRRKPDLACASRHPNSGADIGTARTIWT